MKLQYSSSFGVLSFLWAESQGYRCECFNFLLLFWSSLFQLNIYSVQEALRRGKDNASKVAGKLSSGCTWLSKEFQHLSVCLFTDICVCMCLLQGLKCSLTAGGEAIGKKSRVFTSGYCGSFASPAMKHMVLLFGGASVILCTF